MAGFRASLILVIFLLSACRETFFYNSKDYKLDDSGRKFEISEEEARAIWEGLKRRIDNGENLDGTVRTLIKLAQARLSANNPVVPFTLSADRRDALEKKVAAYLGMARGGLNSFGFVDGCDGLLFTSLLATAGYATDLSLAESKASPGKWHRSATQDCLQTGQSASTISRDMILGLSVALWQSGDLAAVERILAYSIANKGFIGEAVSQEERLSRAYMTPQLSGLLYEIQFRLGGADNEMRGYIPDFSTTLAGFEAHLQALRVMLRGAMFGGVVEDDLNIITVQLARNPNNALFKALRAAYTDGDMNATADLLLNPKYFPATRLPTSADRCDAYLWQREEASADWLPCASENKTHAGVDFLFAAQFVLGNFRTNQK